MPREQARFDDLPSPLDDPHHRPSDRRKEAEDGWKRMLAWFRKHGVA